MFFLFKSGLFRILPAESLIYSCDLASHASESPMKNHQKIPEEPNFLPALQSNRRCQRHRNIDMVTGSLRLGADDLHFNCLFCWHDYRIPCRIPTSQTLKPPPPPPDHPILFSDLGARQVVADFSGGTLSTDAGALLLRQVDDHLQLTHSLALCFADQRHQAWVEHSVRQMLAQRIYGLALGYEDINDHQQVRRDPLLATACDKTDPLGAPRLHPADRGIALAAPATLNRLELSNNRNTRGHKVPYDPAKIQACLLNLGVRCLPKHTREIVLDLDAMGHRLHGLQEGRHFNAYYDDYVYSEVRRMGHT
jgi:hypothetical protein